MSNDQPSLSGTPKFCDLLYHRLIQTLEYMAAIMLGGIMLLTFTDVIARYAFHRPIAASFELTEMTMQVMIYLCIAVAVASNDHIKVTLIDPLIKLVPFLKTSADKISGSIIAISLGLLGFAEINLAQGKANEITPVLELPVAPVAWLIGIALCLSAVLAARAVFVADTNYGEHNA
ncbi:TRAP transporter small permease [Paenochrobactrum sp. BZR 201-1]